MASTWFTTLHAIRESEPDWQVIACYREPIARFLARGYPRLASDLRDDVVQEVLCAMHTSVVARFDPNRGRFRDYLRGVIRNQVKKALSRGQAVQVDPATIAVCEPEEVEAVDLSAQLIRAVRAFHDRMLRGKDTERQTLYCLSDRLIDGLSYSEIAAREGISTDAVKRRLQTARRGILRALLENALSDAGLTLKPRRLTRLAERVAEGATTRRPVDEVLGADDDPAWAVASFQIEAIRTGVRLFPGLDSPDGQAFVSALRGILES